MANGCLFFYVIYLSFLLGWLYFSTLHCKLHPTMYDGFSHGAINCSEFLEELIVVDNWGI